jgi:hypothetical protein
VEKRWHCQYCGETQITDAAGFGNTERWKQLERNERFYNFMKGKDPDVID